MADTDDSSNVIQNTLSSRFSKAVRPIIPRGNILDEYASYTYNISLYFLTKADYARMVSERRPVINGNHLLMSTGGAPQGSGNRNQFFPLDYYIDDVSIQQAQPGAGTRGANGIVSLRFKITEPYGITFLDNLYSAIDAMLGGNNDTGKKENYSAQVFLMHIKFYGFDSNGLPAPAVANRDPLTVTDNRSIIEKFIPFRFTSIKYSVGSNLVEYVCDAVVPQNDIGTGQGRGVIPYNIELNATTLAEAFSAKAIATTANNNSNDSRETTPLPGQSTLPQPSKADASASRGTAVNSVVDALNNFQKELTMPMPPDNQRIYDEYDEFEVIFTDPAMASASTQPPGPTPKDQVSTIMPGGARTQLLGAAQSVNNDSKKISAVAGTTLIQFLDQVIRSSSYIYDQQIQGYDADGALVQMSAKDIGLLAWYRIGVQAVPKAYDRKRNDYAYKITYQVSPYIINDPKSGYFPKTEFRGVHKKYDYWFTGNNTQIISYQQDFNYSYYIVMSGPTALERTTNFREYEKRLYQPKSNEADQGQSTRINEPAANLAERQYSASDLSKVRMTIVGDPAWIHQGEVWRGIAGNEFTTDPFLADGTINVEVEEPLYMVTWNKPADYDLNTGLADPTARQIGGGNRLGTVGADENSQLSVETSQAYVYRAITVTSNFSKGKFTQDIEGAMLTFPNLQIEYNVAEEVETLKGNKDTQGIGSKSDTAVIKPDNESKSRTPTVKDTPDADSAKKNINSPTEPNIREATAEGTFANAKQPRNPDSNGETLLPATNDSVTDSATLDVSELRKTNPELAKEYDSLVDKKYNEIAKDKVDKALSALPDGTSPSRILQAEQNAQARARTEAEQAAKAELTPKLAELNNPKVFSAADSAGNKLVGSNDKKLDKSTATEAKVASTTPSTAPAPGFDFSKGDLARKNPTLYNEFQAAEDKEYNRIKPGIVDKWLGNVPKDSSPARLAQSEQNANSSARLIAEANTVKQFAPKLRTLNDPAIYREYPSAGILTGVDPTSRYVGSVKQADIGAALPTNVTNQDSTLVNNISRDY